MRVGENGLDLDVAGEGADKVRRDARNLVVKSMYTASTVWAAAHEGWRCVA